MRYLSIIIIINSIVLFSCYNDGNQNILPLLNLKKSAFPVVWDSDWMTPPSRTDVPIIIDTMDYDFIYGLYYAWSDNYGEIQSPIMGAQDAEVAPAYVSLSGNELHFLKYNALAYIPTIDNGTASYRRGGNIRLKAIKKAPQFNSGWIACIGDQTYIINHNLMKFPTFAILEFSENADGTGWRVPEMSAAIGFDTKRRGSSIIKLDTTQAIVSTGESIAEFRNEASGTIVRPSSGYFRLLLYSIKPDFDSGWVEISNATGDDTKWFNHNLGGEPALVMLYFSDTKDLSGYVLPAMSPYFRLGNIGTSLYNIDNNWAVVIAGNMFIAQFRNEAGVSTSITSGFIRLFAWK